MSSTPRQSEEYGFGSDEFDGDGGDGDNTPRHTNYGYIDLSPFRKEATEDHLKSGRKVFEKNLRELQVRADGNYKSKVTLGHLKLGRTLGEGNFGRVLVCEPSGVTSPIKLENYMALKIQPKKVMAKNKKRNGAYSGRKKPGVCHGLSVSGETDRLFPRYKIDLFSHGVV